MKPLKKIKKKPARKKPTRGNNILTRGFQVLTGQYKDVIKRERRAARRKK